MARLAVFAACAVLFAARAATAQEPSPTPTPEASPEPTPVADAGVQELEIIAAKPVTAASSSEVLREDLDARSLFTPEDVLRVVPNLVVGQHAGGGKADQLFLRGFDADHGTDVALSVDGVPVNAVSHAHGQGYADLHFLIPETIETVVVDRGPYRAAQGDFATAGSIDFRLRERFEAPFATAGGGSFGTGRAVFGLSPELAGGNVLLAGEVLATDGPFQAPQRLRRFNGLARWSSMLSPTRRLRLTASSYGGRWNASGQVPLRAVKSGEIGRYGSIDPTEGGASSREALSARLDLFPAANQAVELQAYAYRYRLDLFSNFTFFLDDPVDGDGIEQLDDRFVAGADGAWRRQDGPFFSTVGLSVRADDARVALFQQTGRERHDAIRDARIQQVRQSAYAETSFVPSRRVRLIAGVRGDQLSYVVHDRLASETRTRTQSLASPKANLVLSPARWLDLFVNAGTGFHSNDARDVTSAPRASTTLPRAIGSEVGARVQAGHVEASVAVWQLDLDRERVWIGDAGQTEARGATRRRGVEAELRAAPREGLRLDADVAYADARFRADGSLVPLAPRLTGSAGVAVARNGFEASLRTRHIADRPANEDFSRTAEGHTVADLVVGWTRGRTAVRGAVENLTNERYREAQFLFESRLPGEPAPVEDIHFTPANPRGYRVTVTRHF